MLLEGMLDAADEVAVATAEGDVFAPVVVGAAKRMPLEVMAPDMELGMGMSVPGFSRPALDAAARGCTGLWVVRGGDGDV